MTISGVSLQTALPWLLSISATVGIALLRVGLVFVIGYIAIRFARLGLQQLERVMLLTSDAKDQQSGTAHKRAATLTGILRTIALTAIWAVVIIESLQVVGLDVAPILAGAGILGSGGGIRGPESGARLDQWILHHPGGSHPVGRCGRDQWNRRTG
jgi:small-conductance mechanosensitive channel